MIPNPLTMLKRRRQEQAEKRKIQEQEKLIEVLRLQKTIAVNLL